MSHLLRPSDRGLGFWKMNFEGHNHSVHCTHSCYINCCSYRKEVFAAPKERREKGQKGILLVCLSEIFSEKIVSSKNPQDCLFPFSEGCRLLLGPSYGPGTPEMAEWGWASCVLPVGCLSCQLPQPNCPWTCWEVPLPWRPQAQASCSPWEQYYLCYLSTTTGVRGPACCPSCLCSEQKGFKRMRLFISFSPLIFDSQNPLRKSVAC